MRFGDIADIQLQGKGLAEARECLLWAAEQFNHEQVRAILLPGDIFERDQIGDKNDQTGAVVDVFYEFLDTVNAPVYAVSGNHDQWGPARTSALKTIRHPRFNLRDTTSAGRLYYDGFSGDLGQELECLVYYLNWLYPASREALMGDFELTTLRLKSENKPVQLILCAHGQVVGALQNAGHACDGGTFVLPKDFLNCFDYLVLGDFHLRQEVIKGKGGFTGALFQQGQDEEGHPCGIEILDIEEGQPPKARWIECPMARRYETVRVGNLEEAAVLFGRNLEHTSLKVEYPADGSPASELLRESLTPLSVAGVELKPLRPKEVRAARTQATLAQVDDPHAALDYWISEKSVGMDEAQLLRECLGECLGGIA